MSYFTGSSFNDGKALMDKMEKDELVNVEKHTIPVANGELRILVEDGIPKITYHSDCGIYLVEMLASNSLRFLNIIGGK